MKVLIARTDRLGDLVLALPVLDFLKEVRPDWELHLLVGPQNEGMLKGDGRLAGVRTWSDAWDEDRRLEWIAAVEGEGFGAALLLQYRRELALQLRSAGVRRLFGPYSKPTSWFLLHRGLRQRRSANRKHEIDYNLDLAARLARAATPGRPLAPRLDVSPERQDCGRRWRAEEAPSADRVVLVHPGSGGSALDWAPESYATVANRLAARPGIRVFITGSAADADVVRAVARNLDPAVGVLLARFSLGQFIGVVGASDLMIAPSTGPLHLAAALGLDTVGIFPPVPGMAPGRWGQRGGRAVRIVPDTDCPESQRCTRAECPHYNCLAGIDPARVIAAAEAFLPPAARRMGHGTDAQD